MHGPNRYEDYSVCVRIPTNLENLENLELSGNFVNLEKSGKRQGICDMVREFLWDVAFFASCLSMS